MVVEHVVVYALQKFVGKQAEIIQEVKHLKRSSKKVGYVIRLQRAYRSHLIHRMAMEIENEQTIAQGKVPQLEKTLVPVDVATKVVVLPSS